MSTDREITRIVRSWLQTDEHESANRVLDAVFERLDTTPQRRHSWQAWRFDLMRNTLKFALVGATVLVLAALGLRTYVDWSAGPGIGGATPSPTPTSTPVATQTRTTSQPPPRAPSLPAADTLAPGRYPIGPEPFSDESPRLVVTVPAGYQAIGNGTEAWAIVKVGDEPTEFSGLGVWVVEAVYEDPCHWSETEIDNRQLGDFAEDFVAALLAQPGHNFWMPGVDPPESANNAPGMPVDTRVIDVTFDDGYTGKRLLRSVPDDVAFADNKFTDCDEGEYRSWPGRSHQAPSQFDDIWVIEIGRDGTLPGAVPPPFETPSLSGTRLIVATTYFPTTSVQDRAELEAMFNSIDLQVP